MNIESTFSVRAYRTTENVNYFYNPINVVGSFTDKIWNLLLFSNRVLASLGMGANNRDGCNHKVWCNHVISACVHLWCIMMFFLIKWFERPLQEQSL